MFVIFIGGRSGTFQWIVNNVSYDGKYVGILSDLLPIGEEFTVSLTLSTWYHQDISYSINIIKSNEPIPLLNINGLNNINSDSFVNNEIILNIDINF